MSVNFFDYDKGISLLLADKLSLEHLDYVAASLLINRFSVTDNESDCDKIVAFTNTHRILQIRIGIMMLIQRSKLNFLTFTNSYENRDAY